jgi:hypothetical protein
MLVQEIECGSGVKLRPNHQTIVALCYRDQHVRDRYEKQRVVLVTGSPGRQAVAVLVTVDLTQLE